MPIVEIHGKKVHIPEGSNSAKHAVDYLTKYHDNAQDIFEAAHHNHVTGVTHFETHRPAGYTGSTEFTLIHKGDGTYDLRKKDHGVLAS